MGQISARRAKGFNYMKNTLKRAACVTVTTGHNVRGMDAV